MPNQEVINDKLVLEVLKIIAKGESFGYFTIRDEIKKMESFVTLTEEEFKVNMTAMQVNECLQRAGHNEYKLNPEKDCIKYFLDKIQKKENRERIEDHKMNIDYELVQKQLNDYPAVQRRSRNAFKLSILAVSIAAIGMILQLIKWLSDM